ncbi:MAG: hypothetical protein J5645_03815 [Lachnospiraceae bacterium]|nr:hypothetical protein [Lachnospiraceae bacterium]
MAKDKKTPRTVSGKRYRDMYDAYQDEAAEEDSFWKELAAKTGRDYSDKPVPPKVNHTAPQRSTSASETPRRTVSTEAPRKTASAEAPRKAAAAGAAGSTAKRTASGTTRASAGGDKSTIGLSRRTDTTRSGAPDRSVRKTVIKDGPNGTGGDGGDDDGESEAARRRRNRQRAQEKKNRRGRRIFLVGLAVWAVILLVCGFLLWRYTDRCLVDYENSQVENHLARLLQEFETKARSGSIASQVEIPKLSGEFESEDIVKEEYLKMLAAVGKYTCKKNEKSYSTTNPVYDILGDDKVVARMTLTSYNPRRILAILEVCDWKIDEITPVISETNYVETSDYVYTVPSNYTVSVNGKQLTEQYIVKRSELPKDLTLLVDYVTIPSNVTYQVEGLLLKPVVEIRDANGELVSNYETDSEGNIDIGYAPQTGLEMPEERKELAVNVSKKWMDFTTKDLKGSNYGLAEMRSYIVKDTLLYNKAKEYATGIDITFISDHNAANNRIEGLTVKDYTVYSDNCFSAYVYFVKHIKLTRTGEDVAIPMDSTFYFVYYDDTDDGKDNPQWKLLEMIANTNGSKTE